MDTRQANRIYESFLPIWNEYNDGKDVTLPDKLTLIDSDEFDGGAAPGSVFLTTGALNITDDNIVAFAIAHEMSHVIHTSIVRKYNLHWPKGMGLADDAKRGEFLADLVGYHLLTTKFTKIAKATFSNFTTLESKLGHGDVMHPSGSTRVALLRSYASAISRGRSPTDALQDLLKLATAMLYPIVGYDEWKNKTKLTGHYRSSQLKNVDNELLAYGTSNPGNINQLTNAFNDWYRDNPKERTKRDVDYVVWRLKAFLSMS